MRLPDYIVSRLKAARLGHREVRGTSSHSRLLRQWLSILSVGLVLIASAAAYAVWRFDYWVGIEERVSKEEVGSEYYDRTEIESILREFDDKASLTRSLLDQAVPDVEIVASTTPEQ